MSVSLHTNTAAKLSSPIKDCLFYYCSVPGVGWIRVGGTLASLFGFYYIGAALDDVEGRFPLRFYQATILGRVFLSAVFSWLVLSGQSERGLLVLALVNLASAWAQHRQVQLRLEEER